MRISMIGAAACVAATFMGNVARADLRESELVSTEDADGIAFVRQIVAAPAATRAQSRTIYMNRRGATLKPGVNDARTQTSSLVSKQTAISGWAATDAQWAATVACMREIWAPFAVTITDVDPGATPHIEALFGGGPEDIGMAPNVGGVSPFTTSCGIIENSIVFAFTDNLPANPRTICEVMSQEIGHSYGLDHELLASDPMTYLSYTGERSFQDKAVACGEHIARPCGLGPTACRASQNSKQLLIERLGAADGDNTPPTLAVTSPADGATVDLGFTVAATASDNIGVASVTLYVDGARVTSKAAAPFTFSAPDTMSSGSHTILVEAVDAGGNSTMRELSVTLEDGASPFGLPSCSTGGTPSLLIGFAVLVVLRRRRR